MKISSVVIGLLVVLLMAASASATESGINKNIVSRTDTATAHADMYTDSSMPIDTEVGEVTVNSVNGDEGIRITYRDSTKTPVAWWYTFDTATGEMYKFYPLAKGDFVYGEDTASVNTKQVPIKSTETGEVQYIDVSVNWAKQPNGNVISENGKPIDGYKVDYNKYDAIATGSVGIFNPAYGAHGVGPWYWDTYVETTKGFTKV